MRRLTITRDAYGDGYDDDAFRGRVGEPVMALRILSVNVAKPVALAQVNGEVVLSAIGKVPLTMNSVMVRTTNIDGDAQGDLSVHGGPDKAVYAYSADRWPWWEGDHALPCRAGTFGENLTLADADETTVCIGDRLQWGDAVLEVSQPRAPCFKLGLHTARPDVPALLTRSAHSGWYMRVLKEGLAPVHGSVLTLTARSAGPTVRNTFRALFHPDMERGERERIAGVSSLAAAWRNGLQKRLGHG